MARAAVTDPFVGNEILTAQKELITVMGELATAREDLERSRKMDSKLTTSAMVDRVTAVIDKIEGGEKMTFKDWVIPGAFLPSAALDLARTTCRRAERRVAALAADDQNFNIEILRYLNRLSDLCWLLARKVSPSREMWPNKIQYLFAFDPAALRHLPRPLARAGAV
jgi:cob(I)alamin adenosyltransferase